MFENSQQNNQRNDQIYNVVMKSRISLISLVFLLIGCGAAVQTHTKPIDLALSKYSNLYLILEDTSGAVSINNSYLGGGYGQATINSNTATATGMVSGVGVSHATSGMQQALLVAHDLAFELEGLGFNLASTKAESDVIGEFSIGSVRYDPITGWIADQAYLTFRDSKTNSRIASFKAATRFVTPTTKTIVKNLVNSVANIYNP